MSKQVKITVAVAVVLVIAQVVAFLRIQDAKEAARAADWRAGQAEARAMNLENRLHSMATRLEQLR